jgi:hypothetical protein
MPKSAAPPTRRNSRRGVPSQSCPVPAEIRNIVDAPQGRRIAAHGDRNPVSPDQQGDGVLTQNSIGARSRFDPAIARFWHAFCGTP